MQKKKTDKIKSIIAYYEDTSRPDFILEDVLTPAYSYGKRGLIVCKGNMNAWVAVIEKQIAICDLVVIIIPAFTDAIWFAKLQEIGFEFHFHTGRVYFSEDDKSKRPLAVGVRGLNFEDKIF